MNSINQSKVVASEDMKQEEYQCGNIDPHNIDEENVY